MSGRGGAGGPLGARTSGPGALLAASVLSFCFLLTGAQILTTTITVDPPKPIEGQNVTLKPAAAPGASGNCRWYRGEAADNNLVLIYFLPSGSGQTPGPLHSGRETADSDCSLHITNVNVNDSGTYRFRRESPGSTVAGAVDLVVSEFLSKPTVSISSPLYPRELVDSVQLTCDTNATLANVIWLLNRSLVESSSRIQLSDRNRTLSIQQVLRGDAGNYQCQVSNLAFNETSDTLWVPVVYGPDAPVITPNSSTYYVHSDIRLSCKADVFPSASYTWLVDGGPHGAGEELLIPDVSRDQDGNYTCQAENILSHNKASTTLEIRVLGGIYEVTIRGPSSAVEHNPVTLNCTSVGSRDVYYYWLKGGQVVEAGDHVSLENNGSVLTLNRAGRGDAGNYTCFGNNSFSSDVSAPHQLEVFYGPDEPIIEPSQQVYAEESDLHLSCSANSSPPANYFWYHNGNLIVGENTSQLVISSLSLGDAGSYTCEVVSSVTGLSSNISVEITVWELVRNVAITSNATKVLENDVTVLTCSATGTGVSFYWLKGNQILESGGRVSLSDNSQSVTFSPTLRSDSDAYTCFANNSFSSNSSTYTLSVLYGPDDPVISPDRSHYAVGSTLTLSCNADSNPPANYTWSSNNQPPQEGDTFQLPNLTFNDTGNYTCTASNNETGLTRSQVLEIWVVEPVGEVTIVSSPTKVFENNITELTCNARGTDVSYFWLKGNQRLEVGGHISLSNNNQVLTFNTTLRNDSDVYTCFANNSIASNSSTYTLDVLYGPGDPVISPGTSYYAAGSTLTLSCNADSNPPANYAWYFNSQPLQEGDTLQLPNLTFSDTGNYTCTASNTETNLSLSQVLEIWVEEMLSSPILTSSEYLPLEKENVTLECSTSSRPEVTVSWYKDGQPVPTNAVPSGNNRSLTIYNFTRADDGNYTCVAENAVSSATSNPNFITMAYGPDNVKIVQSIKITQGQEQLLALVCSADSNPAAQFRWFVNNSDTGVTDETFPLGLLPSEKQGTYTCQAHNTRTNLTASASRNITSEPANPTEPPAAGGLSGGAIAGIVIGCVAGVILIAGMLYFLCTKTSLGRTERHASNGNILSAPGHNQGVTDTKPKTGEEDIQYSTLAFNANNPPQPAPGAAQPPESTIIYSEIKKK